MSRKKSKKSIIKLKNNIISLLVLIIILLIVNAINNTNIVTSTNNIVSNEVINLSEDNLKVFFLDVGQADSTLIVNKDETMLIDAGNNEDGKLIVEYIKSLGIDKIDYLVGTHAHEDHIGGLDDIINSFTIGTIYFPYTTEKTTTTKTFEDVIDSLIKKDLSITTVNIGDKFSVGDAKCEVMYVDNLEPQETNDQSICIRLEFGEQSFLFMGDATNKVEKSRNWPQTTVLKVGHHGSSSSSSNSFLEEVKPKIAIISVGKDNLYGHPNKTIVKRLNSINASIYRTDELGTILITSDGKTNEVTNFVTNIDGK